MLDSAATQDGDARVTLGGQFSDVDPTQERSGILVVRVWLEPHPGGGMRARISGSGSGGQADEPIGTAASPEGVTAAVRSWLEGFIASGRVDFWELLTDPGDEPVTHR